MSTNTMSAMSPQNVVWITGAGSGMGRAVAETAAARGYRVALSGRRVDALEDTARSIHESGGEALVVPLDATNDDDVVAAAQRIEREVGPLTHLVLSAGLNTPQRYWRDQTMRDFSSIVQTNLVAAASAVSAVLPGMRERANGVVVFISSYSGWRFSPDAGVAYSASKTALASLAESLNAQENNHGIRACHLCPGDVDTDFLSMRPRVPGTSDRATMLSAQDIAHAVQFVLDSPRHVCINELVISPTKAL
ncbi:NADP-dependent 3-hydroxy acid dehydrogenase YdfG [Okibacterium sp. HSC-33S16]|uniref:SDR family oxidoreductase n=1 Tax=Okibacterium sp. HSC-33S16 TaxID=2910965 RepID=UPI00209D8603|nr:SDR family NAD(P)-dependent oxidoreductase [Okibacterium sp. HSC-33S16]MCP2032079.1 NADP-dependent 3-hydroxy acid dehydrogenase YdfG [Okibacterium sp. HSC-33S16]